MKNGRENEQKYFFDSKMSTNLTGSQKPSDFEVNISGFLINTFFLFVTDVTVLSRRVPFKGTKSIANADTEFYCSGSIMAVPN